MPTAVCDTVKLLIECFDKQMESRSSRALQMTHLSPKLENIELNIKLGKNANFVESFLVCV